MVEPDWENEPRLVDRHFLAGEPITDDVVYQVLGGEGDQPKHPDFEQATICNYREGPYITAFYMLLPEDRDPDEAAAEYSRLLGGPVVYDRGEETARTRTFEECRAARIALEKAHPELYQPTPS